MKTIPKSANLIPILRGRYSPLVRRLGVCLITVMFMLTITVFLPTSSDSGTVSSSPTEGNYDFTLKKEYVDVFIQKDGSIDIYYHFEFVNRGYLDGVDVGLPNRFYDKDSARAEITVGGSTYDAEEIRKSPYVYIGLAVEFDSVTQALVEQFGTQFSLDFYVNNPHMVYKNELKDGTVGIRFRPTWFDPEFQWGSTGELRCRVYFPEGFNDTSQAVYLRGHQWDSIGIDNETNLLMANWTRFFVDPNDQEDGDLDVGVGFPKEYVDKYYEHNLWEKFGNAWYFIKFHIVTILIGGFFIFGIVAVFVLPVIHAKKRAKDYFQPKLCVAGAGPRKRLNVVEAAIILERPLNQVLTMILFNLVQKKRVSIDSRKEPMRLRKLHAIGTTKFENKFLNAIEHNGRKCVKEEVGTLNRDLLKDLLVKLVKSTQKKLKGYDYKATKQHYKSIHKHAWLKVKAANTPKEFAQQFSKWSPWMMLEEDFPDRLEKEAINYPHTPYDNLNWHYWIHHDHDSLTDSQDRVTVPVDFNDIMSDFIELVKDANGHMVDGISDFGAEVTKVTNPVPVSSGGSGGYSGGGCACACACACAGGGR